MKNKNSIVLHRPRGTQDIYPPSSFFYEKIYHIVAKILARDNYSPIIFPTFEHEELFTAHLGNDTIVHKEMYTFFDRKGRKLALRPEGTICTARLVIQNSLSKGYPIKLYYWSNMFRYERPQKGRYREFWQLGVELIGASGIYSDYQILGLAYDILTNLGIHDFVLRINYLGSRETQQKYESVIKKVIAIKNPKLCVDCQRRSNTNPLRILDCKICCLDIFPVYKSVWNQQDKMYVDSLNSLLDRFNLPFCYDYSLVRGLDYYNGLIFEVILQGQKSSVLGGGRYDQLYYKINQTNLPAIGFAIGIERLVDYLENKKTVIRQLDIFLLVTSESLYVDMLFLKKKLEKHCLTIDYNLEPKKTKNISQIISYYHPRLLVLLEENKQKKIRIKNLSNKREEIVDIDEATEKIRMLLDDRIA